MPEEIHRELKEDVRDIRNIQAETLRLVNELVTKVGIQNGRVTTNEKAITGILGSIKEQNSLLVRMGIGILSTLFIGIVTMGVWVFFDRTNTVKSISDAIQSIPITVTLTPQEINNLSK